MNATISLDSLWNTIQSLSTRNKKWLVGKLMEELNTQESNKSKEQILTGISNGFKDIKEGKVYPIEQLWNQL